MKTEGDDLNRMLEAGEYYERPEHLTKVHIEGDVKCTLYGEELVRLYDEASHVKFVETLLYGERMCKERKHEKYRNAAWSLGKTLSRIFVRLTACMSILGKLYDCYAIAI